MSAFEVMLFVVGLACVGVLCLCINLKIANRSNYDEHDHPQS